MPDDAIFPLLFPHVRINAAFRIEGRDEFIGVIFVSIGSFLCAAELQPYTIYDIAESDLYVKKRRGERGALLVIPIATKGKLIGVLNLRDTEPRYFTESEVQFLRIVTNEIAIAINEKALANSKLVHFDNSAA